MKDSKIKVKESTHLTYTGLCHSSCHTYLDTSVSLRSHPVVYYKSRKRVLKIRLMNESRCDERLKARVQEAICSPEQFFLSNIFFFDFPTFLRLCADYRTRRESDGSYPLSHLRCGVGIEEEEVHLHTAWNLSGNFAPVPRATLKATKPFWYLHCHAFLFLKCPIMMTLPNSPLSNIFC
jgi:hypothetical protein